MSLSKPRFAGLDGLRGIAAGLVCLTHMSDWGYHIVPGSNFSDLGRSGVVLFFVLSAFLLTSQVLDWDAGDHLRPGKWTRYLEARVLRIWPLFFVVVSFSLLTSHLSQTPVLWRVSWLFREIPVPMSVDSYWRHLGMSEGTDILWTIPVEFKFYLILPLVLISIITLLGSGMVAFWLLAMAIAATAALFPDVPNGVETLPFIGVFLTGVLTAFVHHAYPSPECSPDWHRVTWEMLAWTVLAVFVVTSPKVYPFLFRAKFPYSQDELHTFYAIVWAIMLVGMLRGIGLMRRILNSRFLVFVGTVSYSLYLWHRMPIYSMHRLEYFGYLDSIPGWLQSVIVFAAAVVVAHISYRCIEWPVQRWRTNRQSRARATAHARAAP